MAEHENLKSVKTVSEKEALIYIEKRKRTALKTSIGSALCVLSPAPLILFGALYKYGMSEKLAIILGSAFLCAFIFAAILLLVSSACDKKQYSFLDNDVFLISKRTANTLQQMQNRYRDTYERGNVIGTFLCAASPLMILAVSSYNDKKLLYIAVAVCLLLASLGVLSLVSVGMKWAGYNKLLQKGDYTKIQKESAQFIRNFSAYYWIITVIIYVTICSAAEVWADSNIVNSLNLEFFTSPLYFFSFCAILFFVSAMLIKSYFKTRDEQIKEEIRYAEEEEGYEDDDE